MFCKVSSRLLHSLGQVIGMNLLLERGGSTLDINAGDNNGDTALLIGSYHGHAEIVDLLLKRGAATNRTNGLGYSPLLLACQQGNTPVTDMLLGRYGTHPHPQPVC